MGHRPARDKRVTTHVALTARAFGADAILVSTKDLALERSVRDVVRRFGGDFRIQTGEPVEKVAPQVRSDNLLIVVGAEKVPREMFDLVDWNVAIGHQPHSEVAALAVFLDRLSGGSAIRQEFSGPLRIRPSPRGKVVLESEP